MIVAETAEGYRFITQSDHADLAGQFADRWGNERFDRPEPYAPLVAAAYAHDSGWWAYDQAPHLHDDGAPVDFREMPADAWTELYGDGIDAVAETDPAAGLLVSMHGAGLRKRRYGLSPSWPETPDEYEAFVEREEQRQHRLAAELFEGDGPVPERDRELLAALHGSAAPAENPGSWLWTGYKLLQAWDTLSLAFCVTTSPPGYDPIDDVPTSIGGPDETLSIDPLGDGAFAIDPYPFEESPLSVTVPSRTVTADAFDDRSDLVQAYYEADRELERFTLQRSES